MTRGFAARDRRHSLLIILGRYRKGEAFPQIGRQAAKRLRSMHELPAVRLPQALTLKPIAEAKMRVTAAMLMA